MRSQTFKFRKGNGHRAKGGPGKTCGKCSTCLTHQENAQHGARNVLSVEIKPILVHVVGQNRRAPRTARDHPMVGAPQDAQKVGPDGPSRDPEADQTPEVPIV